MESVPVVAALAGALDMVRPLATPRDNTLRGDWSATGELCVLADKRRLKQVLLNLLSNAVKYNREGGTVTLAALPTGQGRLSIAISDSGIGIAPENLDRLWTPFDRLGAESTNIEGSGVGLALTHRLVEAMGGAITVRSTWGEGSTFTVELPLASAHSAQDEPQQIDAATATPRQLARDGETQIVVLYIEDNLSNLGLVQNILRHRPEIKLLAAMQGRLGIELAIEHRPDVILLDVHLPDIDGQEVLRLLRGDPDTREIPVIVVSADATPRQVERLMAAGADEYLTKPLDVKRFLRVLEENLKAKLQAP
jgi:CheY-like chemotaxis protein